MKLVKNGFSIEYNHEENMISFHGIFRLESIERYNEIMNFIYECSIQSNKDIILNFINLENINSAGIATLSLFFIKIKETKKRIKIITSHAIPWQRTSLEDFKLINDNIEIDNTYYH